MTLNEEDFQKEMDKQKARSRAASQTNSEDWFEVIEDEEQEFVGYNLLSTPVRIVRYRKITNKYGELYHLVFNITPFYAEGGGQVGDKGYLEAPNGNVTYIYDTKIENNIIVHTANQLPADVTSKFKAVVDEQKRHATSCNHTATHLLHHALRSVLGSHVTQKGSMVRSGHLRFDFSHFSKLTQEELQSVEDFVNARIQEKIDAQITSNVPYDQAISDGAMALFGEKYGDTVRTVRFGESIELCGGTHVSNTSAIWHFTITSETAVASGVRRIEAVTGDEAKKLVYEQASLMEAVKLQLKNPKDLVQSVQALQDENTKLKKEIEKLNKQLVEQMIVDLESEIQNHNGVSLLCKEVNLNASVMKDILFQIGKNRKDLVAVLGSKKDNKPILSCYVSKVLVDLGTYKANTIIQEISGHIQGGGGGQPFFATAGGKNPTGLSDALQAVKNLL